MGLAGIVKVGKQGSEVKFNNVKMLRAISDTDVTRHLMGAEVSFIIFEGVGSDELNVITPLLDNLKFNRDDIYFFKGDKEGIENAGLQYYDDLKLLQSHLSFRHNINVRTYKVGVDKEIEDYRAKKLEQERKEREAREEQERLERLEKGESEEPVDEFSDLFEEKEPDIEETITDETEENTLEFEMPQDNGVYVGSVLLQKEKTSDERAKSDLEEALLNTVANNADREIKEEIRIKENKTHIFTLTPEDEEVIYNEEIQDEAAESKVASEEYKELQEELRTRDKRLEITEERLEKLLKIREALAERVGFYEGLITKLETTEAVTDISTKDSEETLAKLNDAKLTIKQLENKIIELQRDLSQIDELHHQLEDKDTTIEGLKADLVEARSDDKYKEIAAKLEREVAVRLQLLGLIKNVTDAYSRTLTKAESLSDENSSLKATNMQLTKALADSTARVNEIKEELGSRLKASTDRTRMLSAKVEEFNRKLIDSSNQITEAVKEKEDALNRASSLAIENEQLRSNDFTLKSELSTAKTELEVQKNLNSDLTEKINQLNAVDVQKLREDKQISELGNTQMLQELGRTKQELQALKFQLGQRDEVISKLSSEKDRMEIMNKSLSRNIASAEKLMIDVNYTGKANIIPVFGSGSYGVTTTVMSIAKKLTGNVLVLDFDCTNPKIDSWVGINPMIKELQGLSGIDQSAFGALLKLGTDYVIENRELIFRRAFTNAKSRNIVYYFSGLYTQIDLSQFAAIDFQQFLNFIGGEYDHIVVDLGRLGGNETGNALIRMFNRIAWKNIMVCLHDKNDVRTTFINSKRQGISYTKTIWLLNMANNTKVDPSMQKILANMRYIIFMKEMKCYGEKMTFTEFGNPNKDKLAEIVERLQGEVY